MNISHYAQLAGACIAAGLGAACVAFPSHAGLFGGLSLVALAAIHPLSVATEIKGDK